MMEAWRNSRDANYICVMTRRSFLDLFIKNTILTLLIVAPSNFYSVSEVGLEILLSDDFWKV